MRIPGTPSLVFLVYLLFFLPWAAFRSARRIREARTGITPLPSRTVIWTGSLVSQGALLALAWSAGRGFGYGFFSLPSLGSRDILAALLTLAAYFALRAISRAVRSEEERRKMAIYVLAPRTRREWALWASTVLDASVTEEIAYRGVGMAILWYSVGNPWMAAPISATAFALAHWTQGWKSAAMIFALALLPFCQYDRDTDFSNN